MRYDLKTPCKNCPFRNDATRITFACRERAAEIAESAYRNGFPCHLSAVHVEETDYQPGGFEAGEETQHCAGALIMFLKDGGGNVPFEWLDEDEQDRIANRLDWAAPVFECEDDFLDANERDVA